MVLLFNNYNSAYIFSTFHVSGNVLGYPLVAVALWSSLQSHLIRKELFDWLAMSATVPARESSIMTHNCHFHAGRFTCLFSLNPHDDPKSYSDWGTWHSDSWNNLPEVTQLNQFSQSSWLKGSLRCLLHHNFTSFPENETNYLAVHPREMKQVVIQGSQSLFILSVSWWEAYVS